MSFLSKVADFLNAIDGGKVSEKDGEKALEEAMKPKYVELSEPHSKLVKRMEDALKGKTDSTRMEGVIFLKDEDKKVANVSEAKAVIEQIKLGKLELA